MLLQEPAHRIQYSWADGGYGPHMAIEVTFFERMSEDREARYEIATVF